jgi:2'-5' RNA ligase
MEQIRSFVAIELPAEVKNGLKQVRDTLSAGNQTTAKWVDSENIHLTLKFLGNVQADKLPAISQAVQDAADQVTSFELMLNGLGAFPNSKNVQVVWIGLNGQLDVLQTLYKGLEDNLESLGFPPEGRPFRPHLTLARVRDNASPQEKQNLGDLISQTKVECNLKIQVESLSLMKSQLTRAGAIYSCLNSARLKSACH